VKALTFKAFTVTYTLPNLAKMLVLPFAAILIVSPSLAEVSAASISPTTARPSEQAKTKQARAKRAVKEPKQAMRKVAPQPEAVMSAPREDSVGLALKPSQTVAVESPQPAPTVAPAAYSPRVNPYLVNQPQPAPTPASAGNSDASLASSGFKIAMPHIPLFEQSILPKVQTVYPTGEKPLVVVTFKCPTELVGIDTPSTLILHKALNGGMDLINKTNLLSFNMQQVCQ